MKRSADIPRPAPPVVGFADSYTGGFVDGFPTPDRGPPSLLLSGSVTVHTPDRSFVLGGRQGLWIPADTPDPSLCRTALQFSGGYI